MGVKTHLTFQILLCYKVINNSDKEEEGHSVLYQKLEIPVSAPTVTRILWHYLNKTYCFICLQLHETINNYAVYVCKHIYIYIYVRKGVNLLPSLLEEAYP